MSVRASVEALDNHRYRIVFGRPVEAEVALMYFGFYAQVELFWKDGRVASVVAPAKVYERIVADFEGADEDLDESAQINRAVLDDHE